MSLEFEVIVAKNCQTVDNKCRQVPTKIIFCWKLFLMQKNCRFHYFIVIILTRLYYIYESENVLQN